MLITCKATTNCFLVYRFYTEKNARPSEKNCFERKYIILMSEWSNKYFFFNSFVVKSEWRKNLDSFFVPRRQKKYIPILFIRFFCILLKFFTSCWWAVPVTSRDCQYALTNGTNLELLVPYCSAFESRQELWIFHVRKLSS